MVPGMSTKNTLNIVTEGVSGPQSISLPNGDAWDPTSGITAQTLIVRTKPSGAQRFRDYDPKLPPTKTVPLP